MAGLGRKVFTRERATVADVQGYLMDQVNMRFPSASAANTAVPSPAEGMHRYLDDVNRLEYYTGSAWVPVRPRQMWRTVDYGAGRAISSGGANQTGLTGGVPALGNFTLYSPCRVIFTGTFRVGTTSQNVGAALCFLVVDGTVVSQPGLQRQTDTSTPVLAGLDLAAGSHTIGFRVEAFGGAITWYSANVTMSEGAAE